MCTQQWLVECTLAMHNSLHSALSFLVVLALALVEELVVMHGAWPLRCNPAVFAGCVHL